MERLAKPHPPSRSRPALGQLDGTDRGGAARLHRRLSCSRVLQPSRCISSLIMAFAGKRFAHVADLQAGVVSLGDFKRAFDDMGLVHASSFAWPDRPQAMRCRDRTI